MEGSSNALLSASTYLIASNTNVSNFVSVKLSGGHNYLLWKAQMFCLLKSISVCGIVDDVFVLPRYSDPETMRQYENLVSGWIFGSVTEDVLVDVYNLGSAKAVWEKLQSTYDPPVLLPKMKTNIIQEDTNSIDIEGGEDAQNSDKKKKLRAATIKGDWSKVEPILKEDAGLVIEAISNDGSTILHIAVGIGHNDFVKTLFSYINDEQILQRRVSDGSTALHIAAIVGNKDGAELLVKRNNELLGIKDGNDELPLQKAYQNMHLDTIGYLLKEGKDIRDPGDELEVQLLVNAISAKQYSLALEFVHKFPKSASKTDDVLLALAKTFPTGLDYWEELVYPPSFHSIKESVKAGVVLLLDAIMFPCEVLPDMEDFVDKEYLLLPLLLLIVLLIWSFCLILSLIVNVINVIFVQPLRLLHIIWWYCAMILVPPIKLVDNKMKEWDEAKKVLKMVCDEIDKLQYPHTHHPCYTRPILEAARQNAYEIVDEILSRSLEVIESTDKNGYDIIQLAIINRSEKIYNLIYDIGERKNIYRTYKDSSENNILHLAGKLAPPSVLNKRTGAALQLQRELQWREEVKKFVFPSYITQENIYKETPDMVFTREHKDLVKEGEQWIKTTAESCSITAALIVTIVFAAAITIPGGSDQGDGTPLFKKKTAFLIFAISDAISLFASSTALLVFLSILTARFSEKDFLVSLPRRLFIGLFSLLLSTTTMMVAYSATLFLVFSNEKQWLLAPICGLAFIPISFFVGLQFPLMVDLFS